MNIYPPLEPDREGAPSDHIATVFIVSACGEDSKVTYVRKTVKPMPTFHCNPHQTVTVTLPYFPRLIINKTTWNRDIFTILSEIVK